MPVIGKVLDVRKLLLFLSERRPDYATIEDVHSMPRQGVASSFKFGLVTGIVQGVIAALQIPYALVPPATWTRRMCEGVDGSMEPKARSRAAAMRLFPEQSFIVGPRSRVPHDGMIDATLIALYGLRKSRGD